MDNSNFVKNKLCEWNLQEFIENFESEGIDEESFSLLDNETIKILIPKAGPRLKFKKYHNAFLNPPTPLISDSATLSFSDISDVFLSNQDSPSNPDSHSNPDSLSVNDSIHSGSPFLSSTPKSIYSLQSSSDHKKINIKGIIKSKLPDIFEKLEEGDSAKINILQKYRINRLLVNSYIEKYDCRPSTKDKLYLAKDIVDTFPVLKGSEGEGFEQWFCPGVRGAPATGFIADRFKNFRVRNLSSCEKEDLGIKNNARRSEENLIIKKKLLHKEDNSVEFRQKQQWLKENSVPKEKVLQYMKETFEGRRFEITKNSSSSIVSLWPRILNPHVIDAEFSLIYGERKNDSLCLEFGITSNLIILQAKHCGRKSAEDFANSLQLDLSSTEPSTEKICCALVLLPFLLPQGIFKKKTGLKRSKVRPTSSQSLDHFIQFIPVGEGVEKFMREDRLLGGERKQPFVLAIGQRCKPEQTFLIFEENCIEIGTLLKSVDLCFKLSYILNLEFSPYCSNVWKFLNSSFYKCDDEKNMSPCVKELQNHIFLNLK